MLKNRGVYPTFNASQGALKGMTLSFVEKLYKASPQNTIFFFVNPTPFRGNTANFVKIHNFQPPPKGVVVGQLEKVPPIHKFPFFLYLPPKFQRNPR